MVVGHDDVEQSSCLVADGEAILRLPPLIGGGTGIKKRPNQAGPGSVSHALYAVHARHFLEPN